MIKNKILPVILGTFFIISAAVPLCAVFNPLTSEEDNKAIVTILKSEPSLLKVNGPTVVVGDIHGNLESLVRCLLFFKNRSKKDPRTKILFLGDYVDRGKNSVECLETILELKLHNPYNVFILRGNHEDISVSSVWFGQLADKRDFTKLNSIAGNISRIFSNLSAAAVVHDGVSNTFCVHGGISENLISSGISKIDDIKKGSYNVTNIMVNINSKNKFLYHLLWNRYAADFSEKDILKFFEHNREITRIVKGHDMQQKGYMFNSVCNVRDFCIIHSTECFKNGLSGIGYIHDGKIDLGNFRPSNPAHINWNKQ